MSTNALYTSLRRCIMIIHYLIRRTRTTLPDPPQPARTVDDTATESKAGRKSRNLGQRASLSTKSVKQQHFSISHGLKDITSRLIFCRDYNIVLTLHTVFPLEGARNVVEYTTLEPFNTRIITNLYRTRGSRCSNRMTGRLAPSTERCRPKRAPVDTENSLT
jgi:hypothetical protein